MNLKKWKLYIKEENLECIFYDSAMDSISIHAQFPNKKSFFVLYFFKAVLFKTPIDVHVFGQRIKRMDIVRCDYHKKGKVFVILRKNNILMEMQKEGE